MTLLIRNLFENALKTNDSLKFAVLTGCLRVAKESIFTGLNNFKVFPITKVMFDECFGFTDAEVKDMLHYYQQDELYNTVKEWYDGYRFGNVDVYCPWDVINYCDEHLDDPSAQRAGDELSKVLSLLFPHSFIPSLPRSPSSSHPPGTVS